VTGELNILELARIHHEVFIEASACIRDSSRAIREVHDALAAVLGVGSRYASAASTAPSTSRVSVGAQTCSTGTSSLIDRPTPPESERSRR